MAQFGSWDIGEKLNEALRNLFNGIATDVANQSIKLVGDVITSPINFSEKIPHFDSLLSGFQVVGGLGLALFFYQRIMTEMFNEATGVDEINWPKIIGETLIAAGMVYSFPILADQIGAIVAELTNWISFYKVEFKAADEIFQGFAPSPDQVITSSFFMIIMCLFWAIAFVLLTIAGGVITAAKGLFILCSPLVMAAIIVNPAIAKQFSMKLLSLMLAQPYQMLCLYLGMAVASLGGFWGMLGSLAFIILGIFPPFLKTLISSTGMSNSSGSAAKMIMFKIMRR